MLESPTDTDATKKAVVRTYNSLSYADPLDAVQDYERVQAAAVKHPNKGSAALRSIVNLPRFRIRSWVDSDGVPDCYRGLQTTLAHHWIIDNWGSPIAKAMNSLAAWVLSSGSINDNWELVFVTTDHRREIDSLQSYADTIGSPLSRTRDNHTERPMERQPTEDGAVLGRVLHTWTGEGIQKRNHSPVSHLSQLRPHHFAKQFCQIYIQQRGSDAHHSPNFLQISATRYAQFRRDLKSCLQRVVSDPDLVTGEEWPIRVHEPTVSELDGYLDIEPGGEA